MYLNDEVEFLMNNQYQESEKQYNDVLVQYNNLQRNFQTDILEEEKKFKQFNLNQKEAYQMEMEFNVNQDSQNLRAILQNGLSYLLQKRQALDQEVQELN